MELTRKEEKEVFKALVGVYRRTEYGPLPHPEYCSGHDRAVLELASELLGWNERVFYRRLDKETR